MEKVVEEEMRVTELPITLQEKLSAWPEANKLETEEKINKVFKLLEDLGDIGLFVSAFASGCAASGG